MAQSQTRTLFPALRTLMGDWVYYISTMPMSEIAERISVVEDLHTSESLQDELQRAITKNALKIAEYLQNQPQRFFNAIVVGTYGGDPEWHEIDISDRIAELPRSTNGVLGFLELSGGEQLFAIDGQHRVVGIKEAIKHDRTLSDEEVATIFVSGVTASRRAEDPTGFERTRRLFSTLNRYAKPVQKRDIIALDEDDVVAIVCRRLVDEHPLLVDHVAMIRTKSIPATNSRDFTSLVALYDALDLYLRDRMRGWKDFKRDRPPEDEVQGYFEEARKLLDALVKSFRPLKALSGSDPDEKVAGQFRNQSGGHLLFRPVGLTVVCSAIKELVSEGMTVNQAAWAVARAPMGLDQPPWAGLLWDPQNERMLTDGTNQRVAARLLHSAVGGNLSGKRYTKKDLRAELAGLLNRDVSKVRLPDYTGE